MTTDVDPTSDARLVPRLHLVPRLRLVLRVNAAVSALTGALGIALAGPIARLLGVPVVATAVVSGGLVLFAVDVALVSRLRDDRVTTFSRLIGIADVAWVVGTALLVGLGVFEPTGIVIMGAIALVVLGFALVELQGTRTL